MANEVKVPHSGNQNDTFTDLEGYYTVTGQCAIGRNRTEGDVDRNYRSALRFLNVPASGQVDYAGLIFYVDANGHDETYRTGEWRFRIWGINEDNCGDFGNNPLGRSRTSQTSDSNNGEEPTVGFRKEIGVTSAVNGVLQRGGWRYGNALGLIFEPITENNNYVNKYAIDNSESSYLLIRQGAEPNWKPTPQISVAQAFPAPKQFGIRVARPGVNVFSASGDQFFYNSDLPSLRVAMQGKVNVSAGVDYLVAHGLGHKPYAIAYVKSSVGAGRFKMPRYFPPIQGDPYDDNINASIWVNATYMKINASANCEVYYYIFIDELA